jgi:hypothetical protein
MRLQEKRLLKDIMLHAVKDELEKLEGVWAVAEFLYQYIMSLGFAQTAMLVKKK